MFFRNASSVPCPLTTDASRLNLRKNLLKYRKSRLFVVCSPRYEGLSPLSTNLEQMKSKKGRTSKKTGREADASPSPIDQGTMRLNKYIANAGVCSRREADVLIAEGEIQVNGQVVTEMGRQVALSDRVTYQGKVLNPEKMVYVLLNKPKRFYHHDQRPAGAAHGDAVGCQGGQGTHLSRGSTRPQHDGTAVVY